MILLLGGTSETGPIARGLAQAGFRVLVSTATDEPLDIGGGSGVRRRTGRLDEAAMLELAAREGIRAVVDATHPYAAAARTTAQAVARRAAVPYFTFIRPGGFEPVALPAEPGKGRRSKDEGRRAPGVSLPSSFALRPSSFLAADHEQAARIAFSFGRPVLLTTGSNNLAPYARLAEQTGIALVARVLPRPQSLSACAAAGIGPERIIAAKGPFTVEQNREHIRRFAIGVLVTKDSGRAGGVDAKLEAARLEDCRVVVVQRPALPGGQYGQGGQTATTIEDLLAQVQAVLGSPPAK